MAEAPKIKSEPSDQEEVEEILSVPRESFVKVKPQLVCTARLDTDRKNHQANLEIKSNTSSVLLQKTLVKINGVLYFIEKIPEALVQKQQNQNIVPQIKRNTCNQPASCPNCGKILKHRRNLKLHMQFKCNRPSYICEKCSYNANSVPSYLLHLDKCGEENTNERQNLDKNGYFLSFCVMCNTSTRLHSKTCNKCGSINHWQCKNCHTHFKSFALARYHYITKCKFESYYYCLKCFYKSVTKYGVEKHVHRCHPDSILNGISNYIGKTKVSTNLTTAEHICSFCGNKYENAPDLNRHTIVCAKYQLFSRATCEKNKTNKALSQAESNVEFSQRSVRQFIVRHCKTCNKDIELEAFGVTVKKSCSNCLSTLVYKCKKCSTLRTRYEMLVKHIKTICSPQEQFECVQCDFVTYSKGQLSEHHKRVHGDISATCTNCSTYFTNSSYFKRHIKFCGLTATLQCDMCPYVTTRKAYLRRHIIRSHKKPSTPDLNNSVSKVQPRIRSYCVNCLRPQKINSRLKFCKVCNSKLHFRCAICDKTYPVDVSDVCEHVQTYLEQRALTCSRCGNSFMNKHSFQLHENWCGKSSKQYSCKLCAYSTQNLTHLQLHSQQVHRISYKEKLYLKQNCSKQMERNVAKEAAKNQILRKSILKKHLNVHLKKSESNSSPCQKSDKEISNCSAFASYKCGGENKLDLQCKVVLERLDVNTV